MTLAPIRPAGPPPGGTECLPCGGFPTALPGQATPFHGALQ
jgi:hypothetical protein